MTHEWEELHFQTPDEEKEIMVVLNDTADIVD